MDDAYLAARADESYFDWWRVWASSLDTGSVRELDGLLIAITGSPQEWWNIAMVSRPLERPEETLLQAVRYFHERRQRFIVRVREGVDPASERAVEAAGMPYSDTIPGMALGPIPPGPEAPPELHIRTVYNDRTLDDCRAVIAEGFEMPVAAAQAYLPQGLVENERWWSYVGYVSGRAATTSTLLVSGETAGVYFVATGQEFRRRGLGEAMTWHAVREGAAMGCTAAALQASSMGRAIYERMGFRLVSPYKTFVPVEQPA